MTPTPEQEAILQAGRSSNTPLMIEAMAGCAKTTSLQLLSKSLPLKPSLALAFNVKIKKELESRFPQHFEIKTMNGLGHSAWQKAIGRRCIVDTSKIYKLLKEFFKANANCEIEWSELSSMVAACRRNGLIPKPLSNQFRGILADEEASWETLADSVYVDASEELIWATREILNQSITLAFQGTIDYDDQIYMSVLFGGIYPKFPCILVDEAQDLSPLNHRQVQRCIADRIVICGDPRQAIYAFRGADSSSMGSMRKLREMWCDLPLSVTFRCPRQIVARQQSHAPGFTAADSNIEGEVHDWREKEAWTIHDLRALNPGKPIAILCRNNAPVLAAALRIIRSGVGCTVLGSEIGKSLVTLSKKLLPNDGTSAEASIQKIREWAASEISLARANEKEERIAIITDRAECLIAIIESGPAKNAGELRHILTTMFSKENLQITLSTIHKAKGLEWPTVVHLDPWRIPSRFAQRAFEEGNPIPLQQDMNLCYVCETRTQDKLILANLKQMEI